MKYIHRCTNIRCRLEYMTDYPKAGHCPKCWAVENQAKMGKIANGLVWQVRRLESELAKKQQTKPQPMPDAMPPEMIRRLLQLCHPDRHDNSEAANTATRWLLKQREGVNHA